MNNEIKEIRDYISCPQFGDNHYGKWGILRLDQRTKIKDLLDYIINLQQRNDNLQEELKDLTQYACDLEDKICNKNEIITTAIESLTKNKYYIDLDEALNILKGEEK